MDVLSVRIFRVRIMHGAGTCLKRWRPFAVRRRKGSDRAMFPEVSYVHSIGTGIPRALRPRRFRANESTDSGMERDKKPLVPGH